jgi:hypothetical protein
VPEVVLVKRIDPRAGCGSLWRLDRHDRFDRHCTTDSRWQAGRQLAAKTD